MNEDLHDIDRLFKDGLEGHQEELPPSVWTGVSHDLDKKQAAHYREKYHRLRRVAAIFIIFAFVAGSGIAYYTLTKKNGGRSSLRNTSSSTADHTKNKGGSTGASANDPQDDNTANGSVPQAPGFDTLNTAGADKKTAVDQGEERTVLQKDDEKTGMLAGEDRSTPAKNGASKRSIKTARPETGDEANSTDHFFTDQKKTAINTPADKEAIQKANNNTQNFSPDKTAIALLRSTVAVDLKQRTADRKNVAPATAAIIKPKTKQAHSLSITPYFSPNISFDHLEDDDHLAGPGRNRGEAHREEQTPTSFSSGVQISYSLSRKISLQSGFSYTSSSTTILPQTIYAKTDNNGNTRYELHCSSGYSYIATKGAVQPTAGDSIRTSGVTSHLSYLNIPASVSLTIAKGRFSLHPGIGIGANILLSGKTRTVLLTSNGSEQASASISGLKPVYMDGRISLGAEYGLTKKLSISVKPTARLALTPINRQTPVRSYQNYLGIETGIRISL